MYAFGKGTYEIFGDGSSKKLSDLNWITYEFGCLGRQIIGVGKGIVVVNEDGSVARVSELLWVGYKLLSVPKNILMAEDDKVKRD